MCLQEENPIVTTAHSHAADAEAMQAAKARVYMKADATMTKNRPTQIIGETLASMAPAARVACGQRCNLRRMIQRHRRGALPCEPKNVKYSLYYKFFLRQLYYDNVVIKYLNG